MKTSNKILLSSLVVAILTTILFLFIARANVTDAPIKPISKETTSLELRTNHDFKTFDLGHNNEYILDETYEGISISGPKRAVNALRISDGETLNIYYEGSNKLSNEKLIIRIGIKDKKGMEITLNGNAKCVTNNEALLDAKSISANGNSKIELNVKTESLLVFVGGNGKMYGKIEAQTVSATVNGNGRIGIEDDSQMNTLNVSINGNASFTGGQANILSGSINGNGKLQLSQVNNKGNISVSGNGKDRSNYNE